MTQERLSLEEHLLVQRHPDDHAALQTPAKIIPLRRGEWLIVPPTLSEAERGRHFLKVTLPAIPVAVFTLTFLFGYLLSVSGHTSFGVDPTPALIGAFLITMLVSLLCAFIYTGFRHVAGLYHEE
jgi:hypothetical protein